MIQVVKKDGLGNVVEKFFDKTGIAHAVKSAASSLGIEDCGCDKRKELLNNIPVYGIRKNS
jgi:hypothetical protein